MKHLLVLGTIAALALSATAEAKGHKEKKAARQVVARQQVHNTGTTRFAPARTSTVVQRYSNVGSLRTRSYWQPLLRRRLLRQRLLRRWLLSILRQWFVDLDRHRVRLLRLSWVWVWLRLSVLFQLRLRRLSIWLQQLRIWLFPAVTVIMSSCEVQQRLARAGYYHGVIDGVAGRRTRAAIARWESSHGMYADGRIDRELLRSLGVS